MDGGVGDIWSTGAFSFESPLKDLLDSENFTVEQLLEQDELLQELRGMHPTLVQFFSQDESVVKLIQHVIQEEAPRKDDEVEGATNSVPEATMSSLPTASDQDNAVEDDWNDQKSRSSQYTERDVQVLRYPYMACEVICSEINSIVDAVVDGQVSAISSLGAENFNKTMTSTLASSPTTVLDLFFSLLYNTEQGKIDDYRAGYFDKILSVLCRKRPAAMNTYINEGGGKGRLVLIETMIKHLYSQSILQVVQRLMMPNRPKVKASSEADDSWTTSAEGNKDEDEDDEQNQFRSRWSESSEAVDMLISSLLNTSNEKDYELNLAKSQNASEVLITMIQNSQLSSPVLLRLTQGPILPQIMEAASTCDNFSPHDNRLTSAMNVLESLILQLGGYGSVNTEDLGQQECAANSGELIKNLPHLLQRLKGLLRHPSTKEWVSPMQFSAEPQPILGTSRLRIVRLVESLVLLGSVQVDKLLCESDILQVCLDLFWEFEWNSMLHQSVANLLVHIFEGQNSRAILQKYLLVDCQLLQRLVESFETEGEGGPSSPEPVDAGTNDEIEYTGEDYVLPVSDDDIDAALERQEEVSPHDPPGIEDSVQAAAVDDDDDVIERDPRDHSMLSGTSTRSLDLSVLKDMMYMQADAPSHIPSLRKGYMGHVIIVCQALVHACTPVAEGNGTEENGQSSGNTQHRDADASSSSCDATNMDLLSIARDLSGDHLVIAELIRDHPLHSKWQDFVTSTLASETAIQSTPLGGFQVTAASLGPLRPGRPGADISDFNDVEYEDDDDDEDQPGDDVIDMDDNEIDIAASMIDALSLPTNRKFNPDAFTSATRGGGNYLFDDPLGGGHRFDANFDEVITENEDEDADRASSRADLDPPVMDLFAGNLVLDNSSLEHGSRDSENWSNFASFNDVFDSPSRRSFLVEDPNPAAEPSANIKDFFASEEKKSLDDIFGAPSPHDFLLDEAEPEEGAVASLREHDDDIPMTSHYPSSRRRADSDDDSSVDEEEALPLPEDNGDEDSPLEESFAA